MGNLLGAPPGSGGGGGGGGCCGAARAEPNSSIKEHQSSYQDMVKRLLEHKQQAANMTMDETAVRVAEAMKSRGIAVVAFDMDQTISRLHSQGRMTKPDTDGSFEAFVTGTTPSFVAMVAALRHVDIQVAVATHSDQIEYDRLPRGRADHLLGEDLVRPLLARTVPYHARNFFVVAYNPRRHGLEGSLPENRAKNRHMRLISEHYGVPLAQCLLFDDDEHNVRHTRGCNVYLVNAERGFHLDDAVQFITAAPPLGPPLGL